MRHLEERKHFLHGTVNRIHHFYEQATVSLAKHTALSKPDKYTKHVFTEGSKFSGRMAYSFKKASVEYKIILTVFKS